MFHKCGDLKSLDLKSFKTEKVKFMNNIFQSCIHLLELDLSNFDTKNVMTQM